ncbi:MAG: hypothetical protein Q8938_08560 [Bacteroidota bacterium]|nr:hypothetical protein [Bacteroidota bacterium]MDP4257429.1 hypothetical protein [Bacteroidota bacterium]
MLLLACSGNTSQTASDKPTQKGKVSSTMLKIIPTVPSYIPGKSQQDSAKEFLINLYGKARIELASTDSIEFIDQGENFDSVSCNLCGRAIKMEDWQNAMDNAAQRQFADLSFVTPCCHKKTSLNDLTYHSAAGFAKFVITISDLQDDLSDKVIRDLQDILGTPLRKIWAHY